jgi:hypothetical protein
VSRNLFTFCPSPESLWDATFEGGGLMNVVKKVSRQPSVQVVVWIVPTVFSHIYGDNQGQK